MTTDFSTVSRYVTIAIVWVAITAGTIYPQDSSSAGKPPMWYDNLAINGFTSASYSFNANIPDSRLNRMRVFDTDDNSFKIDVIELSLQRLATQPGEAGFCFHLTAGSSVPRVARSSGLDIGDLDFHQMYLRYIADVGAGLTVDIGKFVTPLGYELIEGYDGYNDNATRSFLFGYAIPFTHTGVRISYPLSSAVTGTVIIVNGWDNSIDNNRSKTIGAQLLLAPLAGWNTTLGCVVGSEQTDNSRDLRSVIDFTSSYAISPFLTIGINGDYGREEGVTTSGRIAVWDGLAGYVRCNVSPRCALILRGEHFEDRDGVRTGVSQKLREVTLTPEFTLADGVILRGDVRLDISNENVFQKAGEMTKRQFTLLINAVFKY
jgi:hypothetical protein